MMQTHSTVEGEGTEGKSKKISYWSGSFLVALGVILFVLNGLMVSVENWWAWFILAPAFVLFYWGRVVGQQANGRLPFLARFNFATGLIILVVAVMFLINLDWSVWWPMMLITPGLALIIAGGKGSDNPTAAAWIGYLRWVAGAVIGLGVVFLAHTLEMIDLESFGQFHWWGIFIALPAIGALWQAVRLIGRSGTISSSGIILLFIALVSGGTAVMELLGLSWEIWIDSWSSLYGITAVIFIGAGILLLGNGLRRQS
jgi:hypothetical protein